MANYMTQKMSSGTLQAITYYRKQKQPHPSHDETRAFTQTAKAKYAEIHNISSDQVEAGKFKSSQGTPTDPNAQEI